VTAEKEQLERIIRCILEKRSDLTREFVLRRIHEIEENESCSSLVAALRLAISLGVEVREFLTHEGPVTISELLKNRVRSANFPARLIYVGELRVAPHTHTMLRRLVVGDESGTAVLVVWGSQASELESWARPGVAVQVVHAYVKENKLTRRLEFHISERGTIAETKDDRAPPIEFFTKKISEVQVGDGIGRLVGEVRRIYPEQRFSPVMGQTTTLQRLLIRDDSGYIPVVAWNLSEQLQRIVSIGTVVEIIGGFARESRIRGAVEVHINQFSSIRPVEAQLPPITYATLNSVGEEFVTSNFLVRVLHVKEPYTVERQDRKQHRVEMIVYDDTSFGHLRATGQTAQLLALLEPGTSLSVENVRACRRGGMVWLFVDWLSAVVPVSNAPVPQLRKPHYVSIKKIFDGEVPLGEAGLWVVGILEEVKAHEIKMPDGTTQPVALALLSDESYFTQVVAYGRFVERLLSTPIGTAVLLANVVYDKPPFLEKPAVILKSFSDIVAPAEPPRLDSFNDLLDYGGIALLSLRIMSFQKSASEIRVACTECGHDSVQSSDSRWVCKDCNRIIDKPQIIVRAIAIARDERGQLIHALFAAKLAHKELSDYMSKWVEEKPSRSKILGEALSVLETKFSGKTLLVEARPHKINDVYGVIITRIVEVS